MRARLIFHALAILGLTAMVVFAQEPGVKSTKSAPRANAQSNGDLDARFSDGEARRHSDGIVVDDRAAAPTPGSGQSSSGQGVNPQAVNPKVTPHQPSTEAKNSAHATENLSAADSASSGKAQSTEANRQDDKSAGENPLFSAEMKNKHSMQKNPGSGSGDAAPPAADNNPKRHHSGSGASVN